MIEQSNIYSSSLDIHFMKFYPNSVITRCGKNEVSFREMNNYFIRMRHIMYFPSYKTFKNIRSSITKKTITRKIKTLLCRTLKVKIN